jgi:hypothetical protein
MPFNCPISQHPTGNDDTCVFSDDVMRFVMAVTHVSVSEELGLILTFCTQYLEMCKTFSTLNHLNPEILVIHI